MAAGERMPCPFCGARGRKLVVVGVCAPEVDDGCAIKCKVCLTEGPLVASTDEAEAWKAWARREGARAR